MWRDVPPLEGGAERGGSGQSQLAMLVRSIKQLRGPEGYWRTSTQLHEGGGADEMEAALVHCLELVSRTCHIPRTGVL